MTNTFINILTIVVIAIMVYIAFFDHPEKSHRK